MHMWRLVYLTGLAGLAAFSQQANVNLDYNPHKNTENLIPFGATLNSPDVRDDRTVTFRLKAPDAREVLLTGAVLTALGAQTKPVPFKKGDDGIWTLTIGPLRPDMSRAWSMTGDGLRLLFVTRAEDADLSPFTVVLNWMAELKK